MISQYVDAVYDALASVVALMTRLALPGAICLGLIALGLALVFALRREPEWATGWPWRRAVALAAGYAAAGLVLVGCWSALKQTLPIAREDLDWRRSAEATTNPVPDAPAISQYGPSLASLVERTYTRTLTLPPDFLQRLGAEGVGVLAPYLSNPSADDVSRLVDTFRRSGQDVVFTRQVTRIDEDPVPFTASNVRVKFHRLPGRAYDVDFEGRYTFQNSTAQTMTARFQFPLPQAGTVRDLSVTVAGQPVVEPNQTGSYEWKSPLGPGETREAIVRYRAIGAQTWHYDMGSQRRRVQQFRLDASAGGPVRFLRGSLHPTRTTDSALRWDMSDVVTAQQVGLAFPPDTEGEESYLQALSALPGALALFVLGIVAVAIGFRRLPPASLLAGALLVFALGLGAAPVLANYIGTVAAVLIGPIGGALLAGGVMGWRWLLAAIPAAMVPAAFISSRHSGLLFLIVSLGVYATAVGIRSAHRSARVQR